MKRLVCLFRGHDDWKTYKEGTVLVSVPTPVPFLNATIGEQPGHRIDEVTGSVEGVGCDRCGRWKMDEV